MSVFKLGAGTMNTQGSQPNTYTGSTNVLAGTLIAFKTGGVQGNLTIGNAGTARRPQCGPRHTGTNAIANNAIVTVHGDGTFDPGDDVISQLIVNGGLILASIEAMGM